MLTRLSFKVCAADNEEVSKVENVVVDPNLSKIRDPLLVVAINCTVDDSSGEIL